MSFVWTAPSPGEHLQKKPKNKKQTISSSKQCTHRVHRQAISVLAGSSWRRQGASPPCCPSQCVALSWLEAPRVVKQAVTSRLWCRAKHCSSLHRQHHHCLLPTMVLLPSTTQTILHSQASGVTQWCNRLGSRKQCLQTVFRVNAGMEMPLFWELDRDHQFQS